MAILRTALEEPLLSRQQSSVLREIARAAQLNQGLIEVRKVSESLSEGTGLNQQLTKVKNLTTYLSSEIDRVLSSIKVPKIPDGNQGDNEQTK
jgi:ABC-type polysaccharide/polyol phosphate transport system ATPase subunit